MVENAVKYLRANPRITVCIISKSCDMQELSNTIRSICEQSYSNFEIVLVCSGNDSQYFQIVNKYSKMLKDILCFNKKKDLMCFLKNFFKKSNGDFIVFINSPDSLSRFAFLEIARVLGQFPLVKYIYTDEDTINHNGDRSCPFFKPDWSPDLLTSFPYTGNLSVYSKERFLQLHDAMSDGNSFDLYDLTLKFTESLKEHEIFHIPRVLYHGGTTEITSTDRCWVFDARSSQAHRRALRDTLGRRGIQGSVLDGKWPGSYRMKRTCVETPPVTIIIPTRNRLNLLRNCIGSIEAKTTYKNYEILIVDNRSSDPKLLEYLRSLKHRVVRYGEPFNFSKINNFAARFARGEVLLFLNNDVEVITPDWIESMLEHGLREEVGAVGCKLLYPNGSVQHAGIVLGMDPDESRAVAGHVFKRLKSGDMGYFGLAHVVRNLSAVTAAAMMMRKSVFEAVEGFNEELAVSFNDVDLCLRLRQAGYLIVYTPHAELYHHESATRVPGANPMETDTMIRKWGSVLQRDPYYSPNLSLRSFLCDIAS